MKKKFYQLTEDIEEGEIDVADLDEPLVRVVRDTEYALSQQTVYPELKTLGADLLALFATTHHSMRVLMGLEETAPLLATDALSLCREQIEKLYIIALLIQKPEYWIRRYIRNNWHGMSERYLLQKEELQIPRFQEYEAKIRSIGMDKMRHQPNKSRKVGYDVIVHERAARATKFDFYHPGVKPNQWPKYMKKEDYNRYFRFPTPGRILELIQNPLVKELLNRWYYEYKYYSGFTHTLGEKLFYQHGSRYKSMEMAEKFSVNRIKAVEAAIFESCAATATACTITAQILTPDFGVKNSIKKFWELLSRSSLFGKLLWKGYACKLLP